MTIRVKKSFVKMKSLNDDDMKISDDVVMFYCISDFIVHSSSRMMVDVLKERYLDNSSSKVGGRS